MYGSSEILIGKRQWRFLLSFKIAIVKLYHGTTILLKKTQPFHIMKKRLRKVLFSHWKSFQKQS